MTKIKKWEKKVIEAFIEIKDYLPETNLTKQDLANNVCCIEKNGKNEYTFKMFPDNESDKVSVRRESGRWPEETIVFKGNVHQTVKPVIAANYEINLYTENYNFPKNKTVKINPDIEKLNTILEKLEKSEREKLESLIQHREVNLIELLETVVGAVNNSTEYDVNEFPDLVQHIKENYGVVCKASGKETLKSVCEGAGKLIRETLGYLNLENIKYTHMNAAVKKLINFKVNTLFFGRKEVGHDITFVFNIKTGKWVVLNSKSSAYDYLIFPKEKLDEFVL